VASIPPGQQPSCVLGGPFPVPKRRNSMPALIVVIVIWAMEIPQLGAFGAQMEGLLLASAAALSLQLLARAARSFAGAVMGQLRAVLATVSQLVPKRGHLVLDW